MYKHFSIREPCRNCLKTQPGPFLIILIALVLNLGVDLAAGAQEITPIKTSIGTLKVQKMAGPFDHPWSIAFLPKNQGYLVTERSGTLRLVRKGVISQPIERVPEVRAEGQGGLLDVAIDPDFETTRLIFMTFSEPVSTFTSGTALARARLIFSGEQARLEDLKVIFRQQPALESSIHYGSRIIFSNDKKIFMTLGDRGHPELVQDLSNHIGKIVRINRDGSSPKDNPFIQMSGLQPEIWSFGHRNPQGAAKRPSGEAYFTISHGAAGGDEINLSQKGRNFGWPEVSYGTHYSGDRFPAASRPDVVSPLFYWDPSIAPSGAAFYWGDLFHKWKGNLFVGALRARTIIRMSLQGNFIQEKERLISPKFGRVRDVKIGPNGTIWFCTDDPQGAVYRITN
ncbi:MAG: PQQ-dependent sugar dehydrogenase [Rhodospirillaceae bacterium]